VHLVTTAGLTSLELNARFEFAESDDWLVVSGQVRDDLGEWSW
jgi:hypothetical protein